MVDATDNGTREYSLEDDLRKIARVLVMSALDKKADDLSVLDIRGRTSYCDVLILCSGANGRHVRAIAQNLVTQVKHELGQTARGVEGLETGRWVLVDCGDVVVHIFDQSGRRYYDLDGLWFDAVRVGLDVLGLDEHGEPLEADDPESPAS